MNELEEGRRLELDFGKLATGARVVPVVLQDVDDRGVLLWAIA